MKRETEVALLEALQRFEPQIKLVDPGASADAVRELLAREVKITYYLARMTLTQTHSLIPSLTLRVQYQHTEVSPSDIYVVATEEEVHGALCQYIGNYRSHLILFAATGVDMEAACHRFSEADAAFYPNYLGYRVSSWHPVYCPYPSYDFSFNYRIGRVKLAMMENETRERIAAIAAQMFLPSMTPEAKALLAHNYLAHTVDYEKREDPSRLERSYMQSAYGALIKRKCVCQGYAEAFKRLMDHAGIPCDIVCGRVKGESGYHAWNILKLNGECDNYHIDVTWDSDEDHVSYTYFGLKDSDLEGERTWNREFNARCRSDRNLLVLARRDIMRLKAKLIANGVDTALLGY